jgi:hypothetical protein
MVFVYECSGQMINKGRSEIMLSTNTDEEKRSKADTACSEGNNECSKTLTACYEGLLTYLMAVG